MNRDMIEWKTFPFAKYLCDEKARRSETSFCFAPNGNREAHKTGPWGVFEKTLLGNGQASVRF